MVLGITVLRFQTGSWKWSDFWIAIKNLGQIKYLMLELRSFSSIFAVNLARIYTVRAEIKHRISAFLCLCLIWFFKNLVPVYNQYRPPLRYWLTYTYWILCVIIEPAFVYNLKHYRDFLRFIRGSPVYISSYTRKRLSLWFHISKTYGLSTQAHDL